MEQRHRLASMTVQFDGVSDRREAKGCRTRERKTIHPPERPSRIETSRAHERSVFPHLSQHKDSSQRSDHAGERKEEDTTVAPNADDRSGDGADQEEGHVGE